MPAVTGKRPRTPIKATEFNLFLELIEKGPVEHLGQIAEVLGVDPNTVSEWNKRPEVIEAKAKGINRTLQEMEKAGKRDWRMWEAKAKMLGLSAPTRADITSGGAPLAGLTITKS